MKELKNKYNAIKALAKEMMKLGNISEYLNLLKEANELKLELIRIKK